MLEKWLVSHSPFRRARERSKGRKGKSQIVPWKTRVLFYPGERQHCWENSMSPFFSVGSGRIGMAEAKRSRRSKREWSKIKRDAAGLSSSSSSARPSNRPHSLPPSLPPVCPGLTRFFFSLSPLPPISPPAFFSFLPRPPSKNNSSRRARVEWVGRGEKPASPPPESVGRWVGRRAKEQSQEETETLAEIPLLFPPPLEGRGRIYIPPPFVPGAKGMG